MVDLLKRKSEHNRNQWKSDEGVVNMYCLKTSLRYWAQASGLINKADFGKVNYEWLRQLGEKILRSLVFKFMIMRIIAGLSILIRALPL